MKRHKRDGKRKGTWLELELVQTPAWSALSTTAQALYVWLRLEWNGSNDPVKNNNGNLRFSLRQGCRAMGVKSRETIAHAFRDLQAKGFIRVTEHAYLGTVGAAKSFAYALTDKPIAGKSGPGDYLFKHWKPGEDFEVVRSKANNPHGIGGKMKTCPEDQANPVPKIATIIPIHSRKSARPV